MKEHGFSPASALTVTLSVTTSNTAGTITAGFSSWRVYNAGAGTVFLRAGAGAQTAVAATDMPLGSGMVHYLDVGNTWVGIAAITASGTATVYVTPGHGKSGAW